MSREPIELPCGATGYEDGNGGVVCHRCMTVYGSIGCPCTREKPKSVPVTLTTTMPLAVKEGTRR